MTTPVTTIDQRFSSPEAVAASWDETRRVLGQAELFWITTVRADGRPHVTPLVAVWADDAIYFTTGPGEQKAVNLRANPHVVLTTGCHQWDAGLDVIVEGDAVRVTDEDARVVGLGRQLQRPPEHRNRRLVVVPDHLVIATHPEQRIGLARSSPPARYISGRAHVADDDLAQQLPMSRPRPPGPRPA
jgi:nitroimidazol reductase NimA-like FMN-containing flavoprotein (pyridoxamine 5'-phosphate oxidase superfamily)